MNKHYLLTSIFHSIFSLKIEKILNFNVKVRMKVDVKHETILVDVNIEA